MSRYGLDLGRYSVKLVCCSKKGVEGVERAIDPELDGADRHTALVSALQEVAAELGVRGKGELHVAVPRSTAIVKRMALPDAPADELERMIRFQAAKGLPFELSEMVLAWGRLGTSKGGGLEIEFAAVRRQTLDELRSVVTEAGFGIGSLEVSTQAAARTLALVGGANGGETLLIDVGHTSSDVIVLKDGLVLFSRSASVGCSSEGWLKRLEQEVVRSLVAARTTVDGSERIGAPDALLLAGGGAGRQELVEALQERLKIEPRVLSGLTGDDPLAQVSDEELERGARFVIARGLADPREVQGIPQLDLAHRKQAKASKSSKRRLWAGVAVGALVVLGVGVSGKMALDARADQVQALQEERDNLKSSVARAKRIRGEMQQAERWDARKGRELEVLLSVSKALPGYDGAFLTQLRWVERRPMRLTGRAKDWDTVGTFLSRLEQDPLIRSAKPESIQKSKRRTLLGVDFTSEVVLVDRGVSK